LRGRLAAIPLCRRAFFALASCPPRKPNTSSDAPLDFGTGAGVSAEGLRNLKTEPQERHIFQYSLERPGVADLATAAATVERGLPSSPLPGNAGARRIEYIGGTGSR